MSVNVEFKVFTIKLDVDAREVHVFGKCIVGKRFIDLHKTRKMLEGEWKNMEEIATRALVDAVNESERK